MRRNFVACGLLLMAVAVSWGAEDTKKAADTRKALKNKFSFKWKDTSFGDVLEEMKTTANIHIRRDEKAININKQITYECKDKPLETVLAELLGKSNWGYYVISQKGNAYDGSIFIRVGEERGYPKGEEPGPGDKPKEEKPKEEKPKEKPKEEKPKEEKPKPTEDDPDKLEKDAARKLKLAKQLIEDGMKEGAIDALEEITKKYKDTKAAEEARELLKKLDK